METTTYTTECREIEYPAKCKSVYAKNKHKEKTLQENPECLYADYILLNGKKIKNNLIFHTKHPELWKNAVCNNYQHTFKEGIGCGGRVTICQDESLDTENPILTLTYYKTKGTVLVQGNQTSLNLFEKMFHQLKTEVDINRSSSVMDPEDTINPADTEESEQEEEREPEQKDPNCTHPSTLTEKLRESLSSLELDYTEFRELILTRLTELNNIQQLRKGLQQTKEDHQKSIDDLRQTTYTLQEENTSLRAQMAKIKEDTESRERSLRRQLEHMRIQVQDKSPCTPLCYSSAHIQDYTTGSLTQLSTPTLNLETQPPNATPTPEPSALAEGGQTPFPTATYPDIDPLPAGQADPSSTPSPTVAAKPEPEVVLLIDSNGKYVEPRHLFPGQRIVFKRCRNTGHALELLQRDSLGCPEIIVVHTGTNDLRLLHRDTAQAVTKVAEKACRVLPESRVVISTLLPCTDTPPHVIHDINMEITRNCSSLHLAHHTPIGIWHLYDRLHLDRDRVRVFAKTLKDVALGRKPDSTTTAGHYRTSRHPRNTPSQPSPRHPALPHPPDLQPPTPHIQRAPPHHPHPQPPEPHTQRAPPINRAPPLTTDDLCCCSGQASSSACTPTRLRAGGDQADATESVQGTTKSNSFWDQWNSVCQSEPEELVIQDGDIRTQHFHTLFGPKPPGTDLQNKQILEKLLNMELIFKDHQNPLDFPITMNHLKTKLKTLKNKKACGPDGILNEMLKYSTEKFQLTILKLFNLILNVGYFPESWNNGLITPIFKSGDRFDPQNYRGICVSSCVGKLLCSIINSRIVEFLDEHNVLHKSQIGFMPHHHTSDHIFTLTTLINTNVHQIKNKIYSCFVYFKKAFDCIWHEGLFYGLLESGLGGKTYDPIKSMYFNNRCAIKIGNKRTSYFKQYRRVKQD
ncbi:uncharacterized protein [Thunnus thynnus]|uniref:uncharacterized protein n=1 Tax=Thunnus thynnus TaxID=8237 RepID=UPI003528D825